jgi:O-antigen/teichoic acid export membrane protein
MIWTARARHTAAEFLIDWFWVTRGDNIGAPVRARRAAMIAKLVDAGKNLAQHSLIKNSAALVSGTVVSQGIIFVLSPVLSRTFAVADFGNLANYNAWVTILALLSCLRYEHAIIIARDRRSTNRVIALTFGLCAVSVVLYALLVVLIYVFWSHAGYFERIQGFILLVPVGVLAACIASPLSQLNVKTGHFKRLAIIATIQVLLTIGPQIALGLLKVPNGLILGAIVGSASAGIALCVLTLDRTRIAELRAEIRWSVMRATAVEHIHFPRYTLAADAIGVVVQQFIPVLILALFNPALAGLYAFSIRIVRVPLIVIATAASNALRKEGIDHLHSERGLLDVFKVTTKGMFLIAVVPFVTMLLFAKPMFSAVFGHQWLEAGRIVQILSPGILFEFVAFPLSVFFLITNSQYYTLVIQAAGFVTLVVSLVIGKFYFKDFIGTCFLISGTMVLVNLAMIILAERVAKRATRTSLVTLAAHTAV